MTHPYNQAWPLVRAAAEAARNGTPLVDGRRYAFDGEKLTQASAETDNAVLAFEGGGWRSLLSASDERQACLELYLPLIDTGPSAPRVLGQLGQSLDGFIATANGQSHFVTGPTSILHLHCLRALCDCVIVGAGTVAADNPRLTTRLVNGPNPVRVVLDPQLRLPISHGVFSDGLASTLRVRARGVPLSAERVADGVEDIEIAAPAGKLDLDALIAELRSRGLRTVLVEGGGVTVSAFLVAGLIDRLHLVVAPFLMGEGRPGVRVPSPAHLKDCLRPPPRVYALGSDVLFDCDLRTVGSAENVSSVIRRVL